ncbi:MAG TPA: hypothetical protein VG347_08230 [Verrucomicrobiae bacterium]|nr:hypothetical protein [Verrucomicrobiae bacterium]
MINRTSGEISFQDGLHITPHCLVRSLKINVETLPIVTTQKLSLKDWKRHVLGIHISEHGAFEIEALSAEEDRIQVVLLSHRHSFYDPNTVNDAERRTFHEGVISLDLAGQREFSWGEVLCRLETTPNKDWLVVAYSSGGKVPLPGRDVLLGLRAYEGLPEDDK